MSSPPESTSDNLQAAEYTALCENMRVYGNRIYAVLTFFLTSNGFLFSKLCFGQDKPCQNAMLAATGSLLTVLFFMIGERSADFYHHYRKRAIELEARLGFRQFTVPCPAPKPPRLKETWAIRLLYALVLCHWLGWLGYAACQWSCGS